MGGYEAFEASYKRIMDGIDKQVKAYEREADDFLKQFD